MLDSFDLKLNKHIRIEGQVYNETFDFPHFDDKYAPPPSGSQAHIHNYHDGPLLFEDDQYFDPSSYDSQHIVNLDDGPQYPGNDIPLSMESVASTNSWGSIPSAQSLASLESSVFNTMDSSPIMSHEQLQHPDVKPDALLSSPTQVVESGNTKPMMPAVEGLGIAEPASGPESHPRLRSAPSITNIRITKKPSVKALRQKRSKANLNENMTLPINKTHDKSSPLRKDVETGMKTVSHRKSFSSRKSPGMAGTKEIAMQKGSGKSTLDAFESLPTLSPTPCTPVRLVNPVLGNTSPTTVIASVRSQWNNLNYDGPSPTPAMRTHSSSTLVAGPSDKSPAKGLWMQGINDPHTTGNNLTYLPQPVHIPGQRSPRKSASTSNIRREIRNKKSLKTQDMNSAMNQFQVELKPRTVANEAKSNKGKGWKKLFQKRASKPENQSYVQTIDNITTKNVTSGQNIVISQQSHVGLGLHESHRPNRPQDLPNHQQLLQAQAIQEHGRLAALNTLHPGSLPLIHDNSHPMNLPNFRMATPQRIRSVASQPVLGMAKRSNNNAYLIQNDFRADAPIQGYEHRGFGNIHTEVANQSPDSRLYTYNENVLVSAANKQRPSQILQGLQAPHNLSGPHRPLVTTSPQSIPVPSDYHGRLGRMESFPNDLDPLNSPERYQSRPFLETSPNNMTPRPVELFRYKDPKRPNQLNDTHEFYPEDFAGRKNSTLSSQSADIDPLFVASSVEDSDHYGLPTSQETCSKNIDIVNYQSNNVLSDEDFLRSFDDRVYLNDEWAAEEVLDLDTPWEFNDKLTNTT